MVYSSAQNQTSCLSGPCVSSFSSTVNTLSPPTLLLLLKTLADPIDIDSTIYNIKSKP